MLSIEKSSASCATRWRREVAAQRAPHIISSRKGFVALAFIDKSNSSAALIDIRKLLVVLLYEGKCSSKIGDRSSTPLRLSGYRIRQVLHGVQWGGEDNCCFFKDLSLTPRQGARGQRIDLCKSELLMLALRMNRRLGRAGRYPAAHRRELRLPSLWTAFDASIARNLRPEGPEFEFASRKKGLNAATLFERTRRSMDGLTLLPLEWVSHAADIAVPIYAELRPCLLRQAMRIGSLERGLRGFQGASEYDLFSSTFRKRSTRTLDRRRRLNSRSALVGVGS